MFQQCSGEAISVIDCESDALHRSADAVYTLSLPGFSEFDHKLRIPDDHCMEVVGRLTVRQRLAHRLEIRNLLVRNPHTPEEPDVDAKSGWFEQNRTLLHRPCEAKQPHDPVYADDREHPSNGCAPHLDEEMDDDDFDDSQKECSSENTA